MAPVGVGLARLRADPARRPHRPRTAPRAPRRIAAATAHAVTEAHILGRLVTQLALWCGQASFFLVLSLYLQQGRRLNALPAGLVFSILAVPFVAMSLRAPGWTMRSGRRLIAIGAMILAAGDLLLLACVSVIGTHGSVAVLAPGLLLVGAGQGLCITPITATVLSSLDPQHAGAAAGVLSTTQQVGNALGVAVTGVIFFSALDGGIAHAYTLSLAELAALLLGVAALTRLLPERNGP